MAADAGRRSESLSWNGWQQMLSAVLLWCDRKLVSPRLGFDESVIGKIDG